MTDIDRLRNLLDVLKLRKRDLSKLVEQVRQSKLDLDTQISNKSRAKDALANQTINISIIDAHTLYTTLTAEHDKVQRHVNNLTRIIASINIEEHITEIIAGIKI